jgi:hypothetical protein
VLADGRRTGGSVRHRCNLPAHRQERIIGDLISYQNDRKYATAGSVPELTGLLGTQPARVGHAGHWPNWRRRRPARARWYHQRTRLARDIEIALVS